jgi:hypothetical protein
MINGVLRYFLLSCVVLVLFMALSMGCITTGKNLGENAAKEELSSPVSPEKLVITLERTGCYGNCPVYSLTINGEGTVVYHGKDFVKTKGVKETTISMESIYQILAEFEEAEYFSLKESYIGFGKSDMPHANTSISLGNRTKSIKHYLGDQNAPKKLTELENQIDEIVNSAQWIK